MFQCDVPSSGNPDECAALVETCEEVGAECGFVGNGWELSWPNVADWIGTPTGSDLHLFRVVYDVLLWAAFRKLRPPEEREPV